MTWTKVQSFAQAAQDTATAVNNTAVTLGSAVAVGDLILVETTLGNSPLTTGPTLTDQLGNTYNRVLAAAGGQLYDSGNNQGTDAWWCIVTTAGTPTITYDPDATTQPWLAIKGEHFTGSDAASTLRDSKGALQTNPGTGANAIATASVAAQSGDLLWGASGNPGPGFTTEAGGTGFTASAIDTTSSLITEWKTASGASTVTFTDATNGAGTSFMTFGLAITPAAAGGAAPLPHDLQHTPQHQSLIAQ